MKPTKEIEIKKLKNTHADAYNIKLNKLTKGQVLAIQHALEMYGEFSPIAYELLLLLERELTSNQID